MDLPDRRSGHGVETEQRARGHHNLPAILLRKLNKVFVVEKCTRAKNDRGLSASYKRRND
jgi:hypothetical protein